MRRDFIRLIALFVTLTLALPTEGEVRLPALISDGMVLQRDSELNIWGWASPDEEIAIEFAGAEYFAKTGSSGRWEVTLPPMAAGGPYTMIIRATNRLTINDILIGDVWLCSGQSNMELPVSRVRPLYEEEIAAAENSSVRSFVIPKEYNFSGPQSDLPGGRWVAATPETVADFSAVAWFFAREINRVMSVPVGVIISAYGGSPAEAWISAEGLKEFPAHTGQLSQLRKEGYISELETEEGQRSSEWYRHLNESDSGCHGEGQGWYGVSPDSEEWGTIQVPEHWSATPLKGINGSVWYKKEFDLPRQAAGRAGTLNLGRIVDADSTFINGIFIGSVSYQYPPRWYTIPEGVLKEGRNLVTVRVISNRGDGGFVADKQYELTAGDLKVNLEGEWRYRIGAVMPPLPEQTFFGYMPTGLYNAMLAPLSGYRMKGVLWYQGESNISRPDEYRQLLPLLINVWRERLGDDKLPFLIVQLPNYLEADLLPSESGWALLREAQAEALRLPATGMAVTYDLGEWNDIHPLNKKDVGERLALAARRVAYHDSVLVSSGPTLRSMVTRGHTITITFDNTGSGLTTSDAKRPGHFAVAGDDRLFTWARAKIRGESVIIRSRKVKEGVAVRYAWADNPEGANLINREGLPAAPFRTDR